MTVKFHPNIANLMVYRGLLDAGFNSPSGISIYSGVQPTAQDILTNWSNFKSTNINFLAHYTGAIWNQPLDGEAKYLNLATVPAAVLPTHAGDASWCIIWASDITGPSLESDTIPNEVFIVGEVTTLAASGIIRFNPDRTFVLGVSKVIADGIITIGLN